MQVVVAPTDQQSLERLLVPGLVKAEAPSRDEQPDSQGGGVLFEAVERKALAVLQRRGLREDAAEAAMASTRAAALREAQGPAGGGSGPQLRFNEAKRRRVGRVLDWAVLLLPARDLPPALGGDTEGESEEGGDTDGCQGPALLPLLDCTTRR